MLTILSSSLIAQMDILSRERPAKLEYQYLKAADQETSNHRKTDEDLFPIHVSANVYISLTSPVGLKFHISRVKIGILNGHLAAA